VSDAPATDEQPESWGYYDEQDDLQPRDLRWFGAGLVVLGTLGFLAAFTLTVDRIRLLQNPSFRPACDLNPVLSCGSVMVTDQAAVFGFPNPLLGIAGFAVVVTLGVLLASGTGVPRWVLTGLAAGTVAGAVMVHWLAFQSIFRINALCPWCLVVWAVTLPLTVWSVLVAARAWTSAGWARGLWNLRYLIVLCWYLLFLVPVMEHFWDYWSSLL
jgi:uncharacterized membrane protein